MFESTNSENLKNPQPGLENLLELGLNHVKEYTNMYLNNDLILINRISNMLRQTNPELQESGLKETLKFVYDKHKNHWRDSQNPFLVHPFQAGYFAAFNQLSIDYVQASLCHDIIDIDKKNARTHAYDIYNHFGKELEDKAWAMTLIEGNFDTQKDKVNAKFQKVQEYAEKANEPGMYIVKLSDTFMNLRSRSNLQGKDGMTKEERRANYTVFNYENALDFARIVDSKEKIDVPMNMEQYLDTILSY